MSMKIIVLLSGLALIIGIFFSCTYAGKKAKLSAEENGEPKAGKGTFEYDANFLKINNIYAIELVDSVAGGRILVAPGLQGRVMTSSFSSGGKSFGWINYPFIEKGEPSAQFNPFGGEERFWIGPEGGPFSLFFDSGKPQDFANWRVPKVIDNEAFDVERVSKNEIKLKRVFTVNNYSGNGLVAGVERTVRVLSPAETESALQNGLNGLQCVAFESTNKLTNSGNTDWDAHQGFLSIWLLCMFNPAEKGVVFIPFKPGSDTELGKKVTDDYFGKVPDDRLKIGDDKLFFLTDGKKRSKIGISPERAKSWCGSYDASSGLLTLLWYSAPSAPSKYVNSKWGKQDDPLKGDVINSYNDGPADDGSIMGPFYEIESSSPAALLKQGESIIHTQRIFHIMGDEQKLNDITVRLTGINLSDIKKAF